MTGENSKREQQATRFAAIAERVSGPAIRPRIWLLEDSPMQAQQTMRALDGHDVVHFSDGGSLLEQFALGAPDALILDWELPGLTGLDVLRFVRQTRDEVTLPILVLTSDEPAMLEALGHGANDFVIKPCEDVVLQARVRTLLRVQALSARARVAEQERTDALERVYDAEARMYVALEAAQIGTWELDPQTLTLQADERCQSIMGIGARAPFSTLEAMVHPDDVQSVREALAASFAPRLRAPLALEFRISLPGGREIWNAVWATPMFDGDTPVRLIGAVLDVTDRKRASAVMERDAAFRERFIAILAHDLRTPLTALRLGSQMLTRRSVTENVAKDLGLRIEATTRRMDRMIADLLDFTRSRQGGGMPVVLAEVDLEPICRSVVQEVELAAPNRSILFESGGDTRARLDGGRLQQIVSNLVSNAIDYSPPSSPVRVTLRGAPHVITLTVQNAGEVIPPDTLKALFDPFRRGAHESTSSRRSRGLGLGLYIVEQIARAHGGTVTAQSTAETGAVFTVTLPR